MIRKLELKDKKEFIKMAYEFYQTLAVIKPTKPKYLNKTLKEIIEKSPYIDRYVYEVDHKIAGYMLITFSYSNELGGNIITIDELYIKEDYQGSGIGSEMLEFVEFKYHTGKAFTLLVNEKNKLAKNLYLKKGFKEIKYIQMLKDNSEI